MALINCPECGRPGVSDTARSCPSSGVNVRERLVQLAEEEGAKRAEEEEEYYIRKKQITIGVLIAVFVVIIIGIGSCIANTPHPLLDIESYTESVTPGGNTFSASGALTLSYSCVANTVQSTKVDFSLMDMSTKRVVWKKTLVCSQQETSETDKVTVASGSYDVGAQIHGDGYWSMQITQS